MAITDTTARNNCACAHASIVGHVFSSEWHLYRYTLLPLPIFCSPGNSELCCNCSCFLSLRWVCNSTDNKHRLRLHTFSENGFNPFLSQCGGCHPQPSAVVLSLVTRELSDALMLSKPAAQRISWMTVKHKCFRQSSSNPVFSFGFQDQTQSFTRARASSTTKLQPSPELLVFIWKRGKY